MSGGTILITGATGYVGGRLVGALSGTGRPLRCMARTPDNLLSRVSGDVEVVGGDVLDRNSLDAVLEGVHTAYYLVHSMGTGADFEAQDRVGARNFAEAAKAAGVKRIIYLGGLAQGDDLSPHLRSRHEVGEILRDSGVLTIELRAAIVIGSGSLSFELIRRLTERLPIMLTPSWVRLLTQPIGIEDLLEYLVATAGIELDGNQVVEVGGRDVVSYADLMQEYARQRGLRRTMIPVPVLTPWLSSLWLGLVTPVFARVGRKLIEGLRNQTIMTDPVPARRFDIQPMGIAEAISRALVNEDQSMAETRWSDAVSSIGQPSPWGDATLGSRIVDSRSIAVDAPPSEAWRPIVRLGGPSGWYYVNALWHLRGFIDQLLGGPGFRRGRPDTESLRVGDPVDFWRVERVDEWRTLRLRAEIKLPGRAWLQYEIEPLETRGSEIHQTAIFDPAGLWGRAYWYALYPFHSLIFRGMLRSLARRTGSGPLAAPRRCSGRRAA